MIEELYVILAAPKRIGWQIQKVDSERNGLIEAMRPCAIRYDKDRVQGSGDVTMERYMERLDIIGRRRARLEEAYNKAVDDLKELIEDLGDPAGVIIMQKYVELLKFPEIAEKVHLSERQTFRVYDEAIANLEKKFETCQ